MALRTDAGDFIETYYKPLNPALEKLRATNEDAGIPLILKETEGMLSVLLDICKPRKILEIGTAYGYSSIFFSCKCPEAHITTIDRAEKFLNHAFKNIDEFGLRDRITVLQGEASEVLRDLNDDSNEMNSYDFVFIDAGKTHYKEYFELSESLCKSGALIVCDNILMSGWIYDRSLPGAKRHRTNAKYMREFLEYLKNREDISVSVSGGGDGLAVIKLNG